MEVSGTVLRQVTCPSFSRRVTSGLSVRPKTVTFRSSSSGFSDDGHLQYYEKKKKVAAVMSTKKKLKMLKGLSKGLSFYPELGFAMDSDKQALFDDLQGKFTSDAAEILMKQLEQVRAEEKELKRKRKQEKKTKKRASKMNTAPDCDESSSSSSSESSDSECDEVVDMNNLRVGVAVAPSTSVDELQPQTLLPKTATMIENPPQNSSAHDHAMDLCSRNDTCVSSSIGLKNESAVVVSTAPQKRIEVCMGNKCKKLGSVALLQEFERVMGAEGGDVVGCKCMGKCKSAPNVRIQNSVDILAEGLNDSVKVPAANPLCIGVGLEDVETIVARFLGDNQQDVGMATAAI